MSEPERIKLAIKVSNETLAHRLALALQGVEGIDLVAPDDVHDIEVRHTPRPRDGISLTSRERAVLALMMEGASNRQIGERLGISVHTAKFHVRRITDKLDAVGRTDAVASALQKEIIGV